MTQEELDALMSGEIDDLDEIDGLDSAEVDESDLSDEIDDIQEMESDVSEEKDEKLPEGYSNDTAHHWPLPETD